MKTIIQIITTKPFTLVAEFDFLYDTLKESNFQVEHKGNIYKTLYSVEDIINKEGITRYIRFK